MFADTVDMSVPLTKPEIFEVAELKTIAAWLQLRRSNEEGVACESA